jgi:hypothetical protein
MPWCKVSERYDGVSDGKLLNHVKDDELREINKVEDQ